MERRDDDYAPLGVDRRLIPVLRDFEQSAATPRLIALLRSRARMAETADEQRLDWLDEAIAAFASRTLADIALKLRFLARESGYLDRNGEWRLLDSLEAALLRAATYDLERLMRAA